MLKLFQQLLSFRPIFLQVCCHGPLQAQPSLAAVQVEDAYLCTAFA